MKKLLLPVLLCCASTLLMAQTAQHRDEKINPKASRTEAKSKAKQMAVGITASEAALTPEELAIAERIHVGTVPCELGSAVTLAADAKNPGYFNVQTKGQKFHMYPVVTSTGAVRLEDKKAGAVWLQLANKSMLMNQKLGQRLADECMSPAQYAIAEAMKKAPAQSVLEPLKSVADATTPAAK
jgi:hypothetical protein